MKKLIAAILTGSVLATSVSHAEMTTLDYLKDYGLPCLAGFAGGMLASKDNGAAIGVGVCLGVGTSTYLQSQRKVERMRDEDFRKFMKLMDTQMKENNQFLSDKTDKAIAEMKKEQDQRIEAVRVVMKEVIAERMATVSDEFKADFQRYVEQTKFTKSLEDKVLNQIQTQVSEQNKVLEADLIKKTVEESVKQVEAKIMKREYGIPTNSEGQ